MGRNTRNRRNVAGISHADRIRHMSNITLVASIMLIYLSVITVVLINVVP